MEIIVRALQINFAFLVEFIVALDLLVQAMTLYFGYKIYRKALISLQKTPDQIMTYFVFSMLFVLNIIINFINIYSIYLSDHGSKIVNLQFMLFDLSVGLVLAVIAILLIVNFFRQQGLQHREQQYRFELEFMNKYLHQAQKDYDKLRSFRHNYRNVLLSMGIFLKQGDLAGLNKYYDEIVSKTENQTASDADLWVGLHQIDDTALKGLVTYKIGMAEREHIKVNLQVTPHFKIAFSQYNTVEAMGIILDNAIEASGGSADAEIDIGLISSTEGQKIIVKNTLNKPVDNLARLKEQGFTTKKNHSGIGMNQLSKIVKGYLGSSLNYQIIDNKFVLTLFILCQGNMEE